MRVGSCFVPFFRRRTSNPTSPNSPGNDAEWALAQSVVDGKTLISRWDAGAKRACPDPSRPVKVTIAVQCAKPQPNGLPSSEDLSAFEAMEEVMFAELPQVAGAQPVLVLTTNGMREWIVYAGTHEWLESWAPDFQQRFMRERPGKIDAVVDAAWETFRAWTAP
jgi:hypothetical protein